MSKEAMKLALEALEANQPVNYCMNNNGEKFPIMQGDPFRFERNSKAITALREALAEQPAQQEPVECANGCRGFVKHSPPAQRKPLTDEQIIASNYPDGEENGPTIAAPDFELICFARQIEAAHGIKENT